MWCVSTLPNILLSGSINIKPGIIEIHLPENSPKPHREYKSEMRHQQLPLAVEEAPLWFISTVGDTDYHAYSYYSESQNTGE